MSFWSSNRGKILGGMGGITGFAMGAGYDAKNAQNQLNSGFDPNAYFKGAPTAPAYQQGWNPSMGISGGMEKRFGAISRDDAAYNKIREGALREGPSKYAMMAGNLAEKSAQDERNAFGVNAAGAKATGSAGLARQGGVTSGNKLSLEREAMRNQLSGLSDINRQLASSKQQIAMNDEQNKMGMQQQAATLAGQNYSQDMNKANMIGQYNMFDVGNQVQESGRQNAFNMDRYGNQGRIWAGGQMANAMDPKNPASPNYDDKKRVWNPFTW